MDDRDREHLGNLIGHGQAALGYARAHGRDWWKVPETLDAVLMRISQVGEAASRTSPEALAEVPNVAWRDVKGIRAKIVHDYQTIDLVVIRGVVSRQLPRVMASVTKALAADENQKRRSEMLPPNAPPVTTRPKRRRPS